MVSHTWSMCLSEGDSSADVMDPWNTNRLMNRSQAWQLACIISPWSPRRVLGWSFCCTLNYSSTRYFSWSGGNTLWPASGLLATWEGTCLANLLPVPTPIYSCSTADFFLNRSLCSLGNKPKLQSVIVYRKSHDKSQNVKNLFSINPISHHPVSGRENGKLHQHAWLPSSCKTLDVPICFYGLSFFTFPSNFASAVGPTLMP